MSAAAARLAPKPRKTTQGWFKVPNSFAENLALLTPAEIALALVVFRREQNGPAVPISDTTWTSWTGLKVRMKDYAMKGLSDKGLRVDGRGHQMRFQFDYGVFQNYVKSTPPVEDRPRTKGRTKAVAAKKGAMVHPQCAERGCALLAQVREDEGAELSLVDAPPNSQPVANCKTPAAPAKLKLVPPPAPIEPPASRTPSAATRNSQPVANSKPGPNAPAVIWSKTVAELQKLFPWVEPVFAVSLASSCRSNGLLHIRDEELAAAVVHAYERKKRSQKEEGLFHYTVPESLAFIRRVATPKTATVPEVSDTVDSALERTHAALVDRGMDAEATAVKELRQRWTRVKSGEDIQKLMDQVDTLEATISNTASRKLTVDERKEVDARVQRGIEPYRERMSEAQLTKLSDKLKLRAVLDVAQIPQMGLLC